MKSRRLWMTAALWMIAAVAQGVEPVDKDLIPEGRAVLALCECEAIPNPDMMANDGPKWLYCLPRWTEGKRHPAEWIRKSYLHEQLITLDDLPNWKIAK